LKIKKLDKEAPLNPPATIKNVLYDNFYDPEPIILPQYRHLKTPEAVKDSLEVIKADRFTKSDLWFKEEAVRFAKDSYAYAHRAGKPGEKVFPDGTRLKGYPNFEALSEEMKNSYFNWRKQFLQGNMGDMRAYYLYLFVGELLNYTFNSSAAFNISMLAQLRRMFSAEHDFNELLDSARHDMLIEVGAKGEASEKEKPVYLRMRGETELYHALERYHSGMDPQKNALAKISINTWKSYFEKPRKNQFFKVHRPKIYKTYKECLTVLDEAYRQQGSSLFEALFARSPETREISLYSTLPVYRKNSPRYEVEVDTVFFSPEMAAILRNYYRLAENVTRTMLGEKRQLKLDAGVLPEGLFEKMLAHMAPKPKAKKAPEPIEIVPVEVTFDEEKISRLQEETEALVLQVEERAEVEELPEPIQTLKVPIKETAGALNDFFAKGGSDADYEDFLDELSELEIQWLKRFKNRAILKKEAAAFLKSKGKMMGSALTQLNEKAQEHLEDNLIEEDGDFLVVLEEFEDLLSCLKEIENEN